MYVCLMVTRKFMLSCQYLALFWGIILSAEKARIARKIIKNYNRARPMAFNICSITLTEMIDFYHKAAIYMDSLILIL